MCGGVLWLSSSGLALLLRSENLAQNIRKMVGLGLAPFIARFLLSAARSENLAQNIRKMVGLGLAPFIARFLLGVESCDLFFGQLFPGQKPCGPRSIFIQAILGIGGIFSVILLLQLLHLFRFALAACKGKSHQKKNGNQSH